MNYKKYYLTSESVTEGHPDKVCDYISDSILDICLEQDENSRVAVETFISNGKVVIAGQITSNAILDIEKIVREIEVGEFYEGTVTKIMPFGAFIDLGGGKEGLLHISKISKERIEKVEDVLNVGDEVEVKVTEIDDKGRVNVSRKVLLPKPERKNK